MTAIGPIIMTTHDDQENQIAKILIIDDNPDNLRMVSDLLEDSDFAVFAAEDGQSGIERAKYTLPDVILLDALMPGIDGFETCRRLKSIAETAKIPVIFMTALSDTENKVQAFQAGAVDYITKPFQKEEVLARLMVHLRIRELNAQLSRSNETLEHRVAKRTEQLVQANGELERKIIDHRHALEALQTSERKFKAIFDQSVHFIGYIGLDGKVLQANQTALDFIDQSISDVKDVPFWETAWWSHSPELQNKLRNAIHRAARGEWISFEVTHRSAEGMVGYFDFSIKPVRDEFGRTFLLAAEGRNITELKEANQALTEAKNYLDKIINSVADPIFVKNRDHKWVMFNDAFCNFLGFPRERLIGQTDYDFFPESEVHVFWEKDEQVFTSGEENINEETITAAGGEIRTIVTKKTRYRDEKDNLFIVGIIRDITEQKMIEAQLRQAVKMEAIGTLAGGVAHDFNNLMTAVIGYSTLFLQTTPEDTPLRKDIEQIKKAGERAASLTQQLLAFSRKQVVQPQVLNLNGVLKEIQKMLERLIGEDIELESRYSPELWQVLSDPTLIEQVIMNLAINARDAMPRGGKLTIETLNTQLDKAYTRHHLELMPGEYVMMAVSDNGIGMDKETQSHIFEPFYTTKAKGKGTGLGLATVYGIVKQTGGHIMVYSEPGQGTTFKIYLPKADGDENIAQPGIRQKPIAGGRETIFVVEDDDTVRMLTKEILRSYGYNVVEASNGPKALEIANDRQDPVDMLVTDVVMPEMGGRQVAEALVALFPAMKVMYISGYTDDAIVHHGVLESGVHFLQKPFAPQALAEKVRNILDENTQPGKT